MRMRKIFTYFAAALLTVAMVAPSGVVRAADYPSQTIRIIVPWKAGGGTDALTRGLASAMREIVDVSVVVTAISGASGAIGTLQFLGRKANGYTLYFNGNADFVAMLAFNPNFPATLDDFTYVGGVITMPVWLISNAKRGYETLDDLIQEAKQHRVTIGTAGLQSMHAVIASYIRGATGATNIDIIAYEGGATLKVALLGNRLDAALLWAPVMLPAIKAGKINVLAAGAPLDKITYAPLRDTKTFKDYGLSLRAVVTRGVYVRKDTPSDTVNAIRRILKKAVKSETFTTFGKKFGFVPVWMGPKAFKAENYQLLETINSVIDKYPLKR